MGFHRRIINSDISLDFLHNEKLSLLYSSESLIFTDELSSKIFELFKLGKKENEILKQLKIEKNEVS